MAELDVELVAADGEVWSGRARMLSAPAADGEIGILPGHTPVLSVLRPGTVRIDPAVGDRVEAQVTGGFLSVDGDRVKVVADGAAHGTLRARG